MAQHILRNSLFLMLLLGSIPACNDDSDIIKNQLTGTWDIVRGIRNKKEGDFLKDGVFTFTPDGKIETNLPLGLESPANYEVDNMTIEHLGSRQTVTYQIKGISDSTLNLTLQLRGFDFEMFLVKRR